MMLLAYLCAACLGIAIIKMAIGGFRVVQPLSSGWLTIPTHYRSEEAALGKSFGVEDLELGFGDIPSMKFESCVVIHLSRTDVYLEYIGLMNSIYPTIKLPIEKMEIHRAQSMWPDAIKVSLPDPACPNFFFENPISKALYAAKLDLSPEFG